MHKIHGNFKDRLLDLFSLNIKSFNLIINYCIDKKNYTIMYMTTIPILDDLKSYNPRIRSTPVYMPEDMENGKELRCLFNNKFYLKGDFTPSTVDVHKNLM